MQAAALALAFYVGFAYAGSYLFLYPLDMPVTLAACARYLLVVLWLLPLTLCLLVGLYALVMRQQNRVAVGEKEARRIFWGCFFLVMAVAAVYLAAYNPAISNFDTQDMFLQAKGVWPVSNWHSPFLTLILRGLLQIWDCVTFVAAVQCAFFAFVLASCASFLSVAGGRRWIGPAFVAVFTLMPNHALQLITRFKDTTYAAGLLWLTLLVAKAVYFGRGYLQGRAVVAETAIALIFTCLSRQNGVVPVLLAAVGLLSLARFGRRIILALAAFGVALALFFGPVCRFFNVLPGQPGGKYMGLSQDMVGVYVAGGEMPGSAAPILELLHTEDYTPYWCKSSGGPIGAIGVRDFVGAYAATFFKNPLLMTRAILCRIDCAWDLTTGNQGLVNDICYIGYQDYNPDWAALYPAHQETVFSHLLDRGCSFTLLPPFLYVFWRVRVYTLCALAGCVVLCALGRTGECVILLPPRGSFCRCCSPPAGRTTAITGP